MSPAWLANTSNMHVQVQSFVRKYKDEDGKVQIPGLKDLLFNIQPNFHNMFICHIMKLVFSDTSPWSNPVLSVYQHEFNQVYSHLQYCLHSDDAVVILVTIWDSWGCQYSDISCPADQPRPQRAPQPDWYWGSHGSHQVSSWPIWQTHAKLQVAKGSLHCLPPQL